jgi:hypothetical protein
MNLHEIKRDLIREKQNLLCSTVDTIEYIELNKAKLAELETQFYNPEYLNAISCLLRAIMKLWSETPGKLQNWSIPDSSLLELIVADETALLDEAYPSILILNDLRRFVPCFKYIFLWTNYGIYQENTQRLYSLETTLQGLTADNNGVNKIMSMMFQLITGLRLASERLITNFDFGSIKVRTVDINMTLPIEKDGQVSYLPTYGIVPVITSYRNCSFPVRGEVQGTPEDLNVSINRLWTFILSIVEQMNPGLYRLFPSSIENVNWSPLLQQEAEKPISCTAESCGTFEEAINAFNVPKKRGQVTVNSILKRYKKLSYRPGPITRVVLNEYYTMLKDIYNKYPDFFTQGLPDSIPVQTENMPPINLLLAFQAGDQLASRYVNPTLSYGTLPEIKNVLILLRDSIRDRIYFDNMDAILRAYGKPDRYNRASAKANQIKDQIRNDMAINKVQIESILNSSEINTENEVLRAIYSGFISPLPSRVGMNPMLTQAIDNQLKFEFIMASDPIDILSRPAVQ